MKRWLTIVAVLALIAALSGGVSASSRLLDGPKAGSIVLPDDPSSGAGDTVQPQGMIRPGGTWGWL